MPTKYSLSPDQSFEQDTGLTALCLAQEYHRCSDLDMGLLNARKTAQNCSFLRMLVSHSNVLALNSLRCNHLMPLCFNGLKKTAADCTCCT